MTKKTKNRSLTPNEQRLRKILRQVSGDVDNLEGELIPPMAIKGSGVIFCYNPSSRELLKTQRGTMVFIIEEIISTNRALIYTYEGHIVEIDMDELISIGFD